MPRRRAVVLAFALLLVPSTVSPASGGEPSPRVRVRMLDDRYDRFRPAVVAVTRGARVRWVNVGEVTHTATGDGWDSGSVAPGERYARRFRRVGTFDYVCVIHPEMTGTIVVERD